MSHHTPRGKKAFKPESRDPALARCKCCNEEVRLSETPSLFPIEEKFLKPLNVIYGLLYVLPFALTFLILSQAHLDLQLSFLSLIVVCLSASLIHYFFASERIKFHVLFTEKPLSCPFAYAGGRFFFFRKKDVLGILWTWHLPVLISSLLGTTP